MKALFLAIFTLLLIGLLCLGEPLLSLCILVILGFDEEYILLRIPRSFPLATIRFLIDSRIGVLKAACSTEESTPRPLSVDGETFLLEKAVSR